MFKKIIFFSFIVILNYILISILVFSFSYLSLINNKTYDLFWIKSIQKKIYFRGTRNIWQYKNECVKFDRVLFYAPKNGLCKFNNPEFKTLLNFKDGIRLNSNKIIFNKKDTQIGVIGDSFAMGWGVNDMETFSSILERKLNKKVYNFGVASYGTIREITKLINSDHYKNIKTIIIQYHFNDLEENLSSNVSKIYQKDEYSKVFELDNYSNKKTNFLLKNFKSSLRLFFSDILDIIFYEKNLRKIDFNLHNPYIEKFIMNNLDYKNKRIIVLHIDEPGFKVVNFPESNKHIEYLNVKLNKSNFFIVDDHLNRNGHNAVAEKLNKYLTE